VFNWNSVRFSTKIALLGIGSVLLTALALVALAAWQGNQYNALALEQIDRAIDDDLSHLATSVYNMVKSQDESAQQRIDSDLNVARHAFNDMGQVSFSQEKVEWQAVNQFTQEGVAVQLPRMLVGGRWLGQNADSTIPTPIVDDVGELVGSTATIFQRMNAQGDMLRVATSVKTSDGRRAVGTYIPAVNPDGAPNPVISAILKKETYHGSAFVVNAWYVTAYEPILDGSGDVIGILYVGAKRDDLAAPLHQTILQTKVGEAGYVYVLGGAGDELGHYIISQNGERDGENIWDTQDAEGRYVIQSIVGKAQALQPGELTTERYLWQNPDDPAPRWKIARIAFYEPWGWVIGASAYEDELQHYRLSLQAGQARMLSISVVASLGIVLLIGLVGFAMARSVTRPIADLTSAAQAFSKGNLEQAVAVERQDELGVLANAFNHMAAQLREMISSLQARTRALETSAEVSHRLSTILDQKQLVSEVVAQVQKALDYYHVHIYLVDEINLDLVMVGGTGQAGREMLATGHKLLRGKGLVGRAAETNTVVLVPDVSQEEGWLPNPLLPDTRAEIAVPIAAGERVLGVLDVQQDVIGSLGQSDAELLRSIAAQVAVALQNTRLFAETRHKADREARINLINQHIQRADTLDSMLQIAARELGQTLGAQRVSVQLAASPDDDRLHE
jgi:putative methionine-R-sulfoxide reductase with GAF domain